MTPAALTQAELDDLKAFLGERKADWPAGIYATMERLIALYLTLINAKNKAGDLLKTLRMAMGIIPKSERGKQLLSKH